MTFRVWTCPGCGAPLPPNARRTPVVCAFCRATVSWDQPLVRAADYLRSLAALETNAAGERRIVVAGVPYRVLGLIAHGESSDVYFAERARRITERVVLKTLRVAEDADLLANEWSVCARLASSSGRGAEHFRQLVPSPVAHGIARDDAGEREAYVYRYASGFTHTLDDVREAQSAGLDPRHIVWIWKRLLEVLGFAHDAGIVHGAVLPAHALVHARDHGVKLIGWACAAPVGEPLRAMNSSLDAHYPSHASTAVLTPAFDLAMSARSMRYLLGDAPSDLESTPVGRLLDEVIDSDGVRPTADAWTLVERLSEAARDTFGPSRYVALALPGWL